MSDAERRSILSQVAEGTLSPDEAAELLAGLDPKPSGTKASASQRSGATSKSSGGTKAGAGGEGGLPPGEPAKRIRVVGSVRVVQIVGDPTVAEASVVGPHDARREGDVLVIEGEGPDVAWSQPGWRWNWNWNADEEPDEDRDAEHDEEEVERDHRGYKYRYKYNYDPFRAMGGRRGRGRARMVVGSPGAFAFGPAMARAFGTQGPGSQRVQNLKVRVNPSLPLEVGIKAGSMSVKSVEAPITAECDAASLQIKGFASPINITVNAGKFEGSGVLRDGESRITCNAGKVDLQLDEGSSVRIEASAELSRVNLPGGHSRQGGLLGSHHDSTIGPGVGSLTLDVNVGAVTVTSADGSLHIEETDDNVSQA